jgi:outer membrane receptor protein involved in Fe transport
MGSSFARGTGGRFKSLGAWATIASAVPAICTAQDQSPELEQIIVTGSRIARPDFTSASPIVTVDAEAFVRTNATSVESVVSRLPQFVPSYTNTSNNPGNGGQGNVQLRGLGETATLVLVDGRRLTPANGNGVVDVNIIPTALVESAEIISGGASATYGSDALAGVVNFKLRHDFDGLQFDGSWSQTERNDGEQYSFGVTGGLTFAEGRGEAYGYVGYNKNEEIFQRAREFSAVSLEYVGAGEGTTGPGMGFVPEGSSAVIDGRTETSPGQLRVSQAAHDTLFARYGYAPGRVPRLQRYGFNADGTVFTMGNGTPGSVANFRGEQDPELASDRRYSYNFGPVNYLLLPLEQVAAFARASFELAPDAEAYAQVLYSDYSADLATAPTAAFPLYVPSSNPSIPADFRFLLDSRPNPRADFSVAKRLEELGPRISSNQHDVWQATAGLQGRVGGDWQYEVYAQAGAYDEVETQYGNTLRSKIHELTFAPDGGQAACGGFNLFGPGSISPECAEYIAVDGTNRQGYDQAIIEASISGSAMSLPAGELRLAFGAMYKRDEFFYDADPVAAVFLDDGIQDIQGFSASDDIEGSDHNTDLYVEALVPMLSGRPGVERLELGLGYRYSDYASAGGVDAYKAELVYLPTEAVRVRSSYQRAVRAPSVYELYLPQLQVIYEVDPGFEGFYDPCMAGSPERTGPDAAQIEALCVTQGVPASLLPEFDGGAELLGVEGGNPALDPETADTLTAGFVLQSWSNNAWLARMQVSLDWYRMEIDSAIATVDAPRYVPWCFDRSTNPDLDPGNEFCNYFSRVPQSGEMTDLQDLYRNLVGKSTSGIDAQLDWSVPAGPGELKLNWLLSWLAEFETVDARGVPPADRVGRAGGTIGSALPEWKSNLNLGYTVAGLTLAAQWRYIHDMRDIEWDYDIPSYDYFDVFASYEFPEGSLDGLTLRCGIENLTDEGPPLLPTSIGANTDPSQFDVLGRRFYVSLSFRL